MTQLEYVRKLISPSKRHKEYLADDFVSYCSDIRAAIDALPTDTRCPDVERFFQKKFVEEMETIGRIWKHHFRSSDGQFRIQYLANDPPDGAIILPSGQSVLIECTTAIDRRWENFALEQWRTKRRVVSLSGFSSKDLTGNRVSGYKLKGFSVDDPDIEEYLCEADDEDMVKQRHGEQIAEVIEKKLAKNYQGGPFWLSVFINESALSGWRYFMRPVLQSLIEKYRSRLAAQNIQAIYFVGNKGVDGGFMSVYPTI